MIAVDEKFWEWLLEEAEHIKLPMRGTPTLRVYLEKKYSEWRYPRDWKNVRQ